jgi:hypothetical protein
VEGQILPDMENCEISNIMVWNPQSDIIKEGQYVDPMKVQMYKIMPPESKHIQP